MLGSAENVTPPAFILAIVLGTSAKWFIHYSPVAQRRKAKDDAKRAAKRAARESAN